MPVSRAHNFAFIHIPRTGGQSVLRSLSAVDAHMDFSGTGLWDLIMSRADRRWLVSRVRGVYPINSLFDFRQQHLPAVVLRRILGNSSWNSLFKFTFVRNPWDWVVSRYHHQVRERLALENVEQDKAALLKRCAVFDDFVRLLPINEIPTMFDMIGDPRHGILVDFIGRFERLNEDLRVIANHLGVTDLPELMHMDPTDHASYRDYYSKESRHLVGRYFARDIARFDYTF